MFLYNSNFWEMNGSKYNFKNAKYIYIYIIYQINLYFCSHTVYSPNEYSVKNDSMFDKVGNTYKKYFNLYELYIVTVWSG